MTLDIAPTPKGEPGKGVLICCCYGDKAVLSRAHAQYPLKFIPTRSHAARLATVYMLSYGGGIVSGDQFNVSIHVEPQAILLLLTQGHTKIFKGKEQQRQWAAKASGDTLPAVGHLSLEPSVMLPAAKIPEPMSLQVITSIVAENGTLLVLPDPVTSFRDSSFQSRQVIRLADETSQLVLLDWFTSGRHIRGESWAFKHYSSRIDVWVKGRLTVKDHMVLEDELYMEQGADNRETSYAARLRPFTCFATLIIISCHESPLEKSILGIQTKAEADRLLPKDARSSTNDNLLWSVSKLLDGRGALVRVAGHTTEQVRNFVKYECLGDEFETIVGHGMFRRMLM